MSFTLNEPIRSSSEQGLNRVGKESKKLCVALEVGEQGWRL